MKVKDVVYCAANINCDFKNKENICTARNGDKCVFSYMPVTKPPIGIMPRDMWDRERQKDLADAIKPPLGVMPRERWDRSRQKDLADAMKRYLEAGMKIPAEWIKEYNEISDRLAEVKE